MGYHCISSLFIVKPECDPLFSQAAAEQKQSVEGFVASIRQAKINPERDAYMALYNEQVPAKKIELAGKFLTDYPETELKMFVYQMQIDSYQRLGNIEKLAETGEKFAADFPQFLRQDNWECRQQYQKVRHAAHDDCLPAKERFCENRRIW